MCRVLSAVDVNDKSVNNIFRASIPRWGDTSATTYMGLQPLAIRGLLHPQCEGYSIKLLTQLLSLPSVCDDIVQDKQATRLITNLIALLPYLCLNIRTDSKHHRDAKLVAMQLSRAGENLQRSIFRWWREISRKIRVTYEWRLTGATAGLKDLEEVFRRYDLDVSVILTSPVTSDTSCDFWHFPGRPWVFLDWITRPTSRSHSTGPTLPRLLYVIPKFTVWNFEKHRSEFANNQTSIHCMSGASYFRW